MHEIITNNYEETQKFAEKFAKGLDSGTVILLTGELGAGKTTFVQGLAKGLGVEGIPNSPSFIVVNEHRGNKKLVHVDLYRLENVDEIADLGLDEYFKSDAITVVEWGERLGELMPNEYIMINIETIGENDRKLVIEEVNEKHKKNF
ncbi:MAG: tRNA (adenosine(37)-N6)-threonylcarbamoyltransferase complex ATPase subunit type 1 TsaE [bacterium]